MKALIIFAKTPVKGRVKTRLQPRLQPGTILKIYKSFISDTVSLCLQLRGVDKFIGCMPTKDNDFFYKLTKTRSIRTFDQRGKDLKHRIANAFEDWFKDGYKEVVLIGSDSPSLPADYIKKAFYELRKNDFVFGPCCDGGLYLVGAKDKKVIEIFRRIHLETGRDVNLLLEKMNSMKARFAVLPFWYDIDTIEDLRFLRNHGKYLNREKLPTKR